MSITCKIHKSRGYEIISFKYTCTQRKWHGCVTSMILSGESNYSN